MEIQNNPTTRRVKKSHEPNGVDGGLKSLEADYEGGGNSPEVNVADAKEMNRSADLDGEHSNGEPDYDDDLWFLKMKPGRAQDGEVEIIHHNSILG